jgi:hypothetical protein
MRQSKSADRFKVKRDIKTAGHPQIHLSDFMKSYLNTRKFDEKLVEEKERNIHQYFMVAIGN